jgi:hypothetical protein
MKRKRKNKRNLQTKFKNIYKKNGGSTQKIIKISN